MNNVTNEDIKSDWDYEEKMYDYDCGRENDKEIHETEMIASSYEESNDHFPIWRYYWRII